MAVFLVSSLPATPTAWDNSNATGIWSTAANWDTNIEPISTDDLIFPFGLSGTITTNTGENARSLSFADDYTLSGGTLALASGNSINVATGFTATINTLLTITGGLSKTGDGTLVLGGSNTNPGGTVISAGKIRAANAGALGTNGIVTTVNSGTTLEVANGITLDRPIKLQHGGTISGIGTATNNGKITLDAAATAVTLATYSSTDVFSIGNGANDITGGSGSTVISLSGAGTVRLGGASDFDGSWAIPIGRLELGAAAALGDQATSVTLSGGTLSARLNTATTFTGPAASLLLNSSSTLISDRTSASAGVTHTLGTLSMGANTLTVAPGANATSGTAGITLGNVTLTGNPLFAINDLGSANGKLTTGSLLGGTLRSIIKSGAGDLTITGGATDLPTGSTFNATGGGTIEMLFPDLGAVATVTVSSMQNPLGEASISITDGALRLLADGSGTSDLQVYQIPNAITLGGNITLDPDRRSGSNTNKTFELSGLTLAAGTVLNISGDNTHGVRLTGPLALSGDATLQGVSLANQDCLLTLGGGISGGASDELTINGGTSPLNLIINAPSTYGGGTTMTGGIVTLSAENAFGTGTTTLSGGTLRLSNTTGSATGNNSIQLFPGATLTGSGSAAGDLNVGGTVNPGATFGTLSIGGSATFSLGSTLRIEINDSATPKNDLLAVTSSLSATGSTLNFDVTGTPMQPVYIVATYTGSPPTGFTATNVPAGYVVDFAHNGNSIALRNPYLIWAAEPQQGLTAGLNAAKTDDPNANGIPNLLEFATNGAPASSFTNPRLRKEIVDVDPTAGILMALTITLPVRSGAIFIGPGDLVSQPVDGIVYRIQASSELVDFVTPTVTEITDNAAIISALGISPPSPGWTLRTFRAPGTPGTSSREFIRVGVQ